MPHTNNIEVISSRNDRRIKRIRALQERRERERSGLYYIEGIRFVAQAAHYNTPVETLVYSPPLLTHPFARRLMHRHEQAGTQMIAVTPEVFYSLALAEDPQGIGAVVRQKWLPLERVKLGGKLCWLALDNLRSPGNLGSILRTSEAVGGAGVILLGEPTDPYDPSTVRASMGAHFSQRFVHTTPTALRKWKEERGWQLVGTSPRAAIDYRQADYRLPTILLIGEERNGLPDEIQANCDLMVRIPMVGHGDSLNVAVATGVLLYEVFNQKRFGV
jgi:TrmH family RNA methyltransferase